jgi:tetratricopeptide (TPR) repeat protein
MEHSTKSLLQDGQRMLAAQDFTQAKSKLQSVLAHQADSLQAHFSLARIYLFEGDLDQSRFHIDAVQTHGEEKWLNHAWNAEQLVLEQKYRAALDILEPGLQQWPDTPELLLIKCRIAIALDDFKEAEALAESALARGAPIDQVHFCHGYIYLGHEAYEQSIESFVATIAANPLHRDGYLQLGKMALAVGAIEDICELFINGIALMPKEMSLREELCEMYLMSNQLEAAFRVSLEILEHRQEVDDFLRAAHLAVTMNRIDAALEGYENAIAMAPDDSRPYLGLGRILLIGGEIEKAGAYFQQALERSSTNPQVLNGLAMYYLDGLKDTAAARKILEEAAAIAPNAPDVRLNQALCEVVAQDWDAAQTFATLAYQQVQSGDPWSNSAAAILEKIQSRRSE